MACALTLFTPAHAQDKTRPFLHPLFSDGAVLQRDRKVPVWGYAKPGEPVIVVLDGGKKNVARADLAGRWTTSIGPVKAGVGHTLDVLGTDPAEHETRRDIAFGDVWLCSGQSNMEMSFDWGIKDVDAERKAANYPNIRFLKIPKATASRPQSTFDARWQSVSSANVGQFSAAGYFFGRELHQKLGVPIGLIDSTWGGTPGQAWASGEAMETMPDFRDAVRSLRSATDGVPYADQLKAWNEKYDPAFKNGWVKPDFDDSAWKTTTVPGNFTTDAKGDISTFLGSVWCRKEVDVPANMAGQAATLSLGTIDDNDDTFWNGELIGSTIGYGKPRSYALSADKMHAGKNILTVRVLNTGGPGGIVGKPEEAVIKGAGSTVSLAGEWRLSRSLAFADVAQTPPPVDMANNPGVPSVLFNGMIAPLTPYALKGAIWYQGESNAGAPDQYKILLPKLISDWRGRFGSGDFPFYIVQLASFMAPDEQPPTGTGWTGLREAQEFASRAVPNSAYSVTTDIGDEKDIHPKDKQDVGKRLALLALAHTYGQKIESSGPTVHAMTVEGDAIRLRFDHAEGGVKLAGESDKVFAIAGADQKWVWATPTVDGNSLVLRAPGVSKPVAARFGWSNFPRGNVYNGAGLPMAPYRSDKW